MSSQTTRFFCSFFGVRTTSLDHKGPRMWCWWAMSSRWGAEEGRLVERVEMEGVSQGICLVTVRTLGACRMG